MSDRNNQSTNRVVFELGKVKSLLGTGGGLLGEVTQTDPGQLSDEEINRWVGVEIGAYRIVEFLDRGGMSLVFRAERCDGEFEQSVAIKVLRATNAKALASRFERERRLLAQLEHPCIAHIVDSGVMDGQPWIAMELVEGVPIDVYCDSHRLTLEERLTLFTKTVEAVQFAHGQLVVHRDLKPSNILVTESGLPKLLDFGIAKALQGDEAVDLTGPEMLLTPMYASPEQVLGTPVGVASDVYQLGLLLYRLLTGGNAQRLDNASVAQIKAAVIDNDPVAPSAWVETTARQDPSMAEKVAAARTCSYSRLSRQLSGDLDAIVLHALEKDPADRYATVQELIADLENYRARRPVVAQVPSNWYRTKRFVQRHRGGVLASVLTGLVLLGSVVAVGLSWRTTLSAQESALEEAAASQQVGDFLIDLLQQGDPGIAGGQDLTVAQLLDSSAQRIVQLDGQDHVQARLLEVVALAYQGLSKFDDAQTLAERALALRESMDEPGGSVEALRILAMTVRDKGDLEAAAEYGRRATQLGAAAGLEPISQARAIVTYSEVLFQQGNYTAQREQLVRANALLAASTGARSQFERAQVFSSMAQNSIQLGKYREAQTELETGLDLLGTDPADQTVRMYMLRSLGGLYSRFGDESRAIDALSESLNLAREIYGSDNAHILGSMVMLARSLRIDNRLAESEALFEETLTTAQATIGKAHGNYARILFDYGLVLRSKGSLSQYRKMQEEAVAVAEAFFGADHSTAVNQRRALALISVDETNYSTALAELNAVLPEVLSTFGQNHVITFDTQHDWAAMFLELGDFERARQELRQSQTDSVEIADGKFAGLERTLRQLSRLSRIVGTPEQAIAYADQAMELRQSLDGGEGWSSFWAKQTHLHAIVQANNPTANVAADALLKLIADNRDRLTFYHHVALARLSPALAQLGRTEVASEICSEALTSVAVASQFPVVAHVQAACARTALMSRQPQTAIRLSDQAVEKLAESLGQDNWQYLAALAVQSIAQENAGTADDGMADDALHKLRNTVGVDSPLFAQIMTLRRG